MPYKDPEKRKEYQRNWSKTKHAKENHIKWKKNNPDKIRASNQKWEIKNKDRRKVMKRKWALENKNCLRNNRLRWTYGITIEEYEAIWDAQKGLCAICGGPETIMDHRTGKIRKLAVDHNHETGEIRELLCYTCNTLLGIAKDSSKLLKQAAEYLENKKSQIKVMETPLVVN